MAGGKIRTKKTKFTALSGQMILPGKEDTWDGQLLKIPIVSPTISNCGLMKVDYSVKVRQLASSHNFQSFFLKPNVWVRLLKALENPYLYCNRGK